MRTDTCEDRENYSNTMIRLSVCVCVGVPGETTHTQTHTQTYTGHHPERGGFLCLRTNSRWIILLLRVMWTGQSVRVTGTLLTQTPSASPPKKKAVQDNTKANKAKARFGTITLLFLLSNDYHPNRKKKSITRCNNPFRPLYIFTYFTVRLHSAMLMQGNLFCFGGFFRGNTPYSRSRAGSNLSCDISDGDAHARILS